MLEWLRKLVAPSLRGRVDFEILQARHQLLDAEHQKEAVEAQVEMLKKRLGRLVSTKPEE